MAIPADTRVLGLSPKARRFVVPFLAVAVAVVLVGTVSTRGQGGAGGGPLVGGDLHAVGELGGRVFVGGHAGAGYRSAEGGWTQIETLRDKDVMGWAESGTDLLAGGHAGLYRSTDDGSTFVAVAGLPVSDVHALGASGDRVYVGSPEVGVLVSDDGGVSFTAVSRSGQDMMGTIWVDPEDSDTAVGPSMRAGAVKTTDGGATWTPLGSSTGSMAVAVDVSGQKIVAIGMGLAEVSNDGGMAWAPLDVPDGASVATYTSGGDVVVASLAGDRAEVYRSAGGTWVPLG